MGAEAERPGIKAALAFVKQRSADGVKQEVQLPDMLGTVQAITDTAVALPPELQFITLDLLRLMLLDPRSSGWFLSSPETTTKLAQLFVHPTAEGVPYNRSLCTLHAACNVFTAATGLLSSSGILTNETLIGDWTRWISIGLSDREHVTLRVAAASLAFNVSTTLMQARMSSGSSTDTKDIMPDPLQVELAAALIQGLSDEMESADVVKLIALSLGRLMYVQPPGAELRDLYEALEVKEVVAKASPVKKEDRVLMHEIGAELVAKG